MVSRGTVRTERGGEGKRNRGKGAAGNQQYVIISVHNSVGVREERQRRPMQQRVLI